MRKLRWVMDGGGFWDLDVSTPKTLDGTASPVLVDGESIPLGLSRGTRYSRPQQVKLMHRFMHAPIVPSFSKPNGLSLQRALSHSLNDHWTLYFLGQFNLQKFISSVKDSEKKPAQVLSWLKTIESQIRHKSMYALGLFSEFQLTPEDTLHLGLELDNTNKPRGKAVFRHTFPRHDLIVEAVAPGLFVDKTGNYWDVPFSTSVDVASVSSNDSSTSYHLSAHYNSESPMHFDKIQTRDKNQNQGGEVSVPPTLLPGLAFKSAFSYRKKVDIWKIEAPELKSEQPYDMFLSNPHVSVSGKIGAAATAYLGENSERPLENGDSKGSSHPASGIKTPFLLPDAFASVSLTAQLGNFQKRFLDLTRFHAQLNIPSGTNFLSGVKNLAHDYIHAPKLSLENVQAICPNANLSFQQQIAGPVSFRVDTGIAVDLDLGDHIIIRPQESVFAIEYALQEVLDSAKAVAWYCPQRQEFMVELRFYEK